MNPILYPNVSRVPSSPEISESRGNRGETAALKGEFDQSLEKALQSKAPAANGMSASAQMSPALQANVSGIKFSAHATQRLRERQIQFDQETLSRLNDAITKADGKGVQDTLVLTDKAALIVSVPSRTVITAMDRNNLNGNVFTNIDGAVIL
jgi:flagellar operon protein